MTLHGGPDLPPDAPPPTAIGEAMARADAFASRRRALDLLRGGGNSRHSPRDARRAMALYTMLRSLHRQARHLGIDGVRYSDLRGGIG